MKPNDERSEFRWSWRKPDFVYGHGRQFLMIPNADADPGRMVHRLDRADAFNEDELLDPDELVAMAAAAPRPRRRRSATVAFEPAELTDSLRNDLG